MYSNILMVKFCLKMKFFNKTDKASSIRLPLLSFLHDTFKALSQIFLLALVLSNFYLPFKLQVSFISKVKRTQRLELGWLAGLLIHLVRSSANSFANISFKSRDFHLQARVTTQHRVDINGLKSFKLSTRLWHQR